LQTSVWLGDLYAHFLLKASEQRKIDTATLHQYANEGTIQTPKDAVDKKLIDGVKYDDEDKR
jgi:protease-4